MIFVSLLSSLVVSPAIAGGCETSCDLESRDEGFTAEVFRGLLADYATAPAEAPELALETLLFHGEETRNLSTLYGYGDLDAAHRQVLERELARTEVWVEMRLVDDSGEVRGWLDSQPVPFGEKQHLAFAGTASLGALITGGRVARVGLAHLWTRW